MVRWEVVFIGGYWRFADHANRLLSVGWKSFEKMDDSIIRMDEKALHLMQERYKNYFK